MNNEKFIKSLLTEKKRLLVIVKAINLTLEIYGYKKNNVKIDLEDYNKNWSLSKKVYYGLNYISKGTSKEVVSKLIEIDPSLDLEKISKASRQNLSCLNIKGIIGANKIGRQINQYFIL